MSLFKTWLDAASRILEEERAIRSRALQSLQQVVLETSGLRTELKRLASHLDEIKKQSKPRIWKLLLPLVFSIIGYVILTWHGNIMQRQWLEMEKQTTHVETQALAAQQESAELQKGAALWRTYNQQKMHLIDILYSCESRVTTESSIEAHTGEHKCVPKAHPRLRQEALASYLNIENTFFLKNHEFIGKKQWLLGSSYFSEQAAIRGPTQKNEGPDLRGVNLAGLNLVGIDPTGANFDGADFSGANLDGWNFASVEGKYFTFSGSSLRGAKIEGKKHLVDGINFAEADLRPRGTECSASTAAHADDLRASFKESTLRGASFNNARLDCVSFYDATILGSDFRGASLDYVNFSALDLNGTWFYDTDLSTVRNLEQTQLDKTCGDLAVPLPSYLKYPSHWTKRKPPTGARPNPTSAKADNPIVCP